MKRKQAAGYLTADVAMFVALLAGGAATWALVTLAALALPVAVVAIMPEANRGS